MNIQLIIKIRNILLFLVSVIVFFGAQIRPATNSGETQSLFMALLMALILFFLHFALWSNYIYDNLRENGLNINYKLFQIIGFTVVSIMLYIVVNVYLVSK